MLQKLAHVKQIHFHVDTEFIMAAMLGYIQRI